MALTVVCPGCQATYAGVSESLMGKKIRCKSCGTVFLVGADGPQSTVTVGASKASKSNGPASSVPLGRVGEGAGLSRVPNTQVAHEVGSKPMNLPLVIGGAVLGGILLAALGGLVIMYAIGGDDDSKKIVAKDENKRRPVDPPSDDKGTPKTQPTPPVTPVPPPPPAPPVTPMPMVAPMPMNPADLTNTAPAAPLTSDSGLQDEVLDRVKRATVFIEVTAHDGQGGGTGSGFFGVEPGIVVTNAHVLGMMTPRAKPPSKVEVFLNAGKSDERKVKCKILAVDGQTDLAILRIDDVNLPTPMKVLPSTTLKETQQIYTVGFPLGKRIGNEVALRKSSVSRFNRKDGVTKELQLEGGADPGNSGGPVVDLNGNVVGVAVAIIRNTTIVFAIPGEHVHDMLNGRVDTPTFGTPVRLDKDHFTIPITLNVIDPLKRIQQIKVSNWTGPANQLTRPATYTPPSPLPGDSESKEIVLTVNHEEKSATGALVYPVSLPIGQNYWFQPFCKNGSAKNPDRWGLGAQYTLADPPVEKRPATLKVSVQASKVPRTLELTQKGTLKLRDRTDKDDGFRQLGITAKLNEVVVQANPTGDIIAKTRLTFDAIDAALKLQGRKVQIDESERKHFEMVKFMAADVEYKKDGRVHQIRGDALNVPNQSRQIVKAISDNVFQSLEAMSIPLPNQNIQAGHTWEYTMFVPFRLPGNAVQLGTAKMKCVFVGTRLRDGREEAVIDIAGPIAGKEAKGSNTSTLTGRGSGTVLIDLVTGQATSAKATFEIDTDVEAGGATVQLAGIIEFILKRGLTAATR